MWDVTWGRNWEEKLTKKEQTPARNLNDATLSDEFNDGTTQRWCPKGVEYNKTEWNV